jgi:hypothetical protein
MSQQAVSADIIPNTAVEIYSPKILISWLPQKFISLKILGPLSNFKIQQYLKVHKNENFFGFDFEFCTISLLVMSKY